MCTTAKEHGAFWLQMIQGHRMGGLLNLRYLVKTGRIVLDAACQTNSILRNTELRPALGILFFWYANQIEKSECRRDKESKLPISSLRARGQARVDQRKWNPTRVRFGGEIGPNLSLNQNDAHRPNYRKRASHDRPVIKRRVHDFDPLRSVFARQAESGRGRRGQSAVQIRFVRAQCVG